MFTGFAAILAPVGVSPYWAITILTSLFASLSLVVMFTLGYQLTRSRFWALIAVLGYFFNCSFMFAVKSSSNKTIVSFITLVFFWYLTRIMQAKQYDSRHLSILGLIFGLTLAAHVSSILVFPCFILLFFQMKKSQTDMTARADTFKSIPEPINSTETPISTISPPLKLQALRTFWKQAKMPFLKVFTLLLISVWVWIGLLMLTFAIIAPGQEFKILIFLSPGDFFQTLHANFFEWEGAGTGVTFRSSQGFFMDLWSGFLFTFYGVETLPTGVQGTFILIHVGVLLFIFALGYKVLVKKHSYLAISLIPFLVWVCLYETYEPERWTWVVLITPLLGILGLQELFVRMKNFHNSTGKIPKRRIGRFCQKHSPQIFAGILLFFLVVPGVYQACNYGVHSEEVSAMIQIKNAIYTKNPALTNELFLPVTVDKCSYYAGLEIYPPKVTIKMWFLDLGALSNSSIQEKFEGKHVNYVGFILFMSNEIKVAFLEQNLVQVELGSQPICENRLGSLYEFKIISMA